MRLKRRPRRRARIGAEIGRALEECSSTEYTVGARLGSFRILLRRDRIVIAAIPVLAPLHNVARHIERAIGRRSFRIGAYGRACIESACADEVRVRMVDGIAPWKTPRVRAARGLLPLRFRGQPVGLARLGAEPVAIRYGRIPIDAENGIPVAIRGAASVIFRILPVRDLILRHGTLPGPESRFVIPRIVAELAPLAV